MVLLILAAVAIGLSVGDNGIITSARNATKQWEEGAEKEQDELKQIANFINSHGNGNGASESGNKIANAKPSPGEGVTTFDETTELEDDLGNIVKVPSGFGIAEESGTKVEEGIVIEDDIGNQFVWIPVGEYKTTNSTKTNYLVRRSWEISNGVAEPVEVAEGETIGTFNEGGAYYGEEDERSLAKDQIEAFKTSANSNKGFYTGRYEQGKGNVIRSMFRDIDAECYIMTDGDDTYPAEYAREMCRAVLERNADMVIGDRLSSTYFTENKRPFHNVGNVLVRKLINMIYKSDIRDVMTGYRAFSYEFVKRF